jgi:hypothetical protein
MKSKRARLDPSQDSQVREEALKTLYRLQAQLRERNDSQPHVLKAIQLAIEHYERESSPND